MNGLQVTNALCEDFAWPEEIAYGSNDYGSKVAAVSKLKAKIDARFNAVVRTGKRKNENGIDFAGSGIKYDIPDLSPIIISIINKWDETLGEIEALIPLATWAKMIVASEDQLARASAHQASTDAYGKQKRMGWQTGPLGSKGEGELTMFYRPYFD